MIVLVDYDNVDSIDRNRGLVYIVERVIRSLASVVVTSTGRARVRLYGGWFDGGRISRAAQRLVPQIHASFPKPIAVIDGGKSANILTRVELAYALECDPGKSLTHTYRARGIPGNLQCEALPFAGCVAPGHCALQTTSRFLDSGQCTTPHCPVAPSTALFRAEQKLVDTMMVADLIHLASRAKEPLAILSNDDDLWPGIHTAVTYGAAVHHVQPRAGRSTPPHYSSLLAGPYFQYSL